MAFARTLRHQPLGVIGILLLVLFVAIAVLAPAISPYDPAAIDLYNRLAPPSHAHWFGTDELGRDIFSRILSGARLSLMVAVSVVGVSLSLGLVLGGLAGFYGGRVDTLLNVFVMNAFLSFPGILLAIAFVAFLGPGLLNLVLALAIGGWVGYARLVRAQVLAVKEREFVEAARALGASDLRIFTRHILPNILQPIIVQAAIGMAGAVLAEATLSFLGLGLPPPAASWGGMNNTVLSRGQQAFTYCCFLNVDLYAQDTWKATSKITLTWESRDAQFESAESASGSGAYPGRFRCDRARCRPAARRADPNAPGQPLSIDTGSAVAARAAVAWEVRPGTVLRSGFGLFSDLLPGSVADLIAVYLPYVNAFRGGLLGEICGRAWDCTGRAGQRGDAMAAANQSFLNSNTEPNQ